MKKDLLLAPIYANEGVMHAYKRQMQKLITAMHKDLMIELGIEVLTTEIVEDKANITDIKRAFAEFGKRWLAKFEEVAKSIAVVFADKSLKTLDTAFLHSLEPLLKAGLTVELTNSERVKQAYEAVIEANVALIKSIPERYLKEVEQLIWGAVMNGHDLATLTTELQARYGLTYKKAVIIARDQSDKAKAAMERARRLDLGITTATWLHSGAGKHPRPSHVEADGIDFSVETGLLIDNEYIQPAEKINCRCTSRAKITGFIQ